MELKMVFSGGRVACMNDGGRRILKGRPAERQRSCGLQVSSTLMSCCPLVTSVRVSSFSPKATKAVPPTMHEHNEEWLTLGKVTTV